MRFTYSILTSLLLVVFFGCQADETNVQETATSMPELSADTVATTMTEVTTQPETVATTTTAAETAADTAASKLPKNHTVDQGGVMHAPGAAENPTQKCGACHGRDLKGGKTAPSCFDCHEQTW